MHVCLRYCTDKLGWLARTGTEVEEAVARGSRDIKFLQTGGAREHYVSQIRDRMVIAHIKARLKVLITSGT